jgi:hypothetical protein
LDKVRVSRAKVVGREILKAKTDGQELLIGEKIAAAPIPEKWLKRT